MDEQVKLDPWFLHDRLVVALIGAKVTAQLPFLDPSHPMATSINHTLLAEALWEFVSRNRVPSGSAEFLAGRLKQGQLVWFDQAFWFRDVEKSYRAGSHAGATFHTTLDVDRAIRVSGEFNPQRITSSSSLTYLTRRQPAFVLGYATGVNSNDITLRPIVIAHRMLVEGGSETRFRDRLRIHPSEIDQFKGVEFDMALERKDLKLLREVPEEKVKTAFAEIIHEPSVPKDWGGELFDLMTNRITVNGERYQAVVAFKGPAKFHPMTLADLGKNGDQIDRLSYTDADLLVVQHCHEITAPVTNMLKVYAGYPGFRRRYMAIDGFDTIRILRHFSYL
ncbi:hypothetical protein GS480_15730 [Rhodococcus hoagii]|nr:hypothetical protein [Prescottella equi]